MASWCSRTATTASKPCDAPGWTGPGPSSASTHPPHATSSSPARARSRSSRRPARATPRCGRPPAGTGREHRLRSGRGTALPSAAVHPVRSPGDTLRTMRYGSAADEADRLVGHAAGTGTGGKHMRRRKGLLVAVVATAALAVPVGTAGAGTTGTAAGSSGQRTTAAASGTGEFVVFYADGVAASDAHAAIAAAGGTVVDEVGSLGIARVTTDDAGFSRAVTASGAVRGVVRNHSVGAHPGPHTWRGPPVRRGACARGPRHVCGPGWA